MQIAAALPRKTRRSKAVGRKVIGRATLARRGAVLLAALAVPALAAPEEWRGFEIADASARQVTLEPMPFEQAGESFPGSAFYYLTSDQTLGLQANSDATDHDPFAGPAARALRQAGSGLDRARAQQCLAAAVYYEAASESDQGQRAVAQVVLNRVMHPAYPNTVCGVVYQGSERSTGCQFSFTCDGSLARRPAAYFWRRAEAVAAAALGGYVERSVGLATHYHTIAVHPYWAPSLAQVGTIGAHRFYRFNGAAGTPGAFRTVYIGAEPIAAPHPRSTLPLDVIDPALDPLAIQRKFEALQPLAPTAVTGPATLPTAALHRTPAPSYAADVQARGGEALYRGEKLPEAGKVRPEFENSGRWLDQPKR